MLSPPAQAALFADLHAAVQQAAASLPAGVGARPAEPAYPPGVVLTDAEREALAALALSPAARTALSKLATDACAYPLFHLFTLLDGVADPASLTEPWAGAILAPRSPEATPMLHDEFFESYHTAAAAAGA